jgi:hydrogenase maturation protease
LPSFPLFKTRIIGIGNPLRRDDGVGCVVAERLRTLLPNPFPILTLHSDLSRLVEQMTGFDRVILIDAAIGISVGQFQRINALEQTLPQLPNTSSHSITLPEVLALCKTLGVLPQSVILYAIGASDFAFGVGISSSLAPVLEQVVALIAEEVSSFCPLSMTNS